MLRKDRAQSLTETLEGFGAVPHIEGEPRAAVRHCDVDAPFARDGSAASCDSSASPIAGHKALLEGLPREWMRIGG